MRIGFSISKIFAVASAAVFVAAFPFALRAQPIDLESTRLPISKVDSAWRFHIGDDARWAQPGFDDSHWPTLQPANDWTKQGYPKDTQLAWFRFHLRAPAHTQSLVLELPTIEKSYQLFSDGTLVGWGAPARPSAQCHRRSPRLHARRQLRLQRKGDHHCASSLAGCEHRRVAEQQA
jgi:hypothetical protein